MRFDDPAGGVLDGATDRMGKWSRRRARQVVEAWPVPVDLIAPENRCRGRPSSKFHCWLPWVGQTIQPV